MRSIDDVCESLGIDLLPWQRDLAQQILDGYERGERVHVARGRQVGMRTVHRVVDEATQPTPLFLYSIHGETAGIWKHYLVVLHCDGRPIRSWVRFSFRAALRKGDAELAKAKARARR